MSADVLELEDIQGIVLFGHARLPHALYTHLAFADGARPGAWLDELRAEVFGSDRGSRGKDVRVHVAFTYPGLRRFGLSDEELQGFPRELRQGMADKVRAHVLGDDDEENAPARWQIGRPDQPHHALLMLYATTKDGVARLRERLATRAATFGISVLHEDEGTLGSPEVEHFGFRDGVAQPYVSGSPRPRRAHEDEVPAGEFVLGYPNAYGEVPPSPVVRDFDLGRNGSYLVYRKLRQHTARFWRSMFEHAQAIAGTDAGPDTVEGEAVKLASRIVGRWPSGAPIVNYPDVDPGLPGAATEPFAFAERDPDGVRCPFGAHIRRANPRDMLAPSPKESLAAVQRHRLLRRGRSYGPPSPETPREKAEENDADASRERGLVFMALNTSLRRQFEFVQQTWVHNPKFAGLYDERDPLIANVDVPARSFTIPAEPARRRVTGLPRFVTVRGGAYLFVPGRRALEWLSRQTRTPL